MIKCNDCGYENTEGLEYCDSCGAALTQATSSATQPAPSPTPSETAATQHAAHAGAETQAAPETSTPQAQAAETLASEAAAHVASAEAEAVKAPAATAEAPVAQAPEAPAAEAPVKVNAKLRIVRGGRKGQEFPLEEGNNLIGRFDPESGAFPEVDLEADDPEAKVSRKHAIIKVENGKVTIEDIGSLNGTYVNRGPRLQPGQPVELKNGDEIIVGKTFFHVIIEPAN